MTKYMSMYGAPSDEDWYGEPECEECTSRKVRWNVDGFFCPDHWTLGRLQELELKDEEQGWLSDGEGDELIRLKKAEERKIAKEAEESMKRIEEGEHE